MGGDRRRPIMCRSDEPPHAAVGRRTRFMRRNDECIHAAEGTFFSAPFRISRYRLESWAFDLSTRGPVGVRDRHKVRWEPSEGARGRLPFLRRPGVGACVVALAVGLAVPSAGAALAARSDRTVEVVFASRAALGAALRDHPAQLV